MNDTSRRVVVKADLPEIRRSHLARRLVFCSGCFDVLHAGHAAFVNQCRALGDVLVVGVGSDRTVRAKKGAGRPVNPQANRVYLVANLRSTDYAVLTDDLVDGSDVREILPLLRPDVYALTENDDEAIAADVPLCRALGIEVVIVRREVPGELTASSTTDILARLSAG